jgi:hypothetical protein
MDFSFVKHQMLMSGLGKEQIRETNLIIKKEKQKFLLLHHNHFHIIARESNTF